MVNPCRVSSEGIDTMVLCCSDLSVNDLAFGFLRILLPTTVRGDLLRMDTEREREESAPVEEEEGRDETDGSSILIASLRIFIGILEIGERRTTVAWGLWSSHWYRIRSVAPHVITPADEREEREERDGSVSRAM
jgi:hypothetical protein